MAVRSTQCQNRAVRSTQGGGGVILKLMSVANIRDIHPRFQKRLIARTSGAKSPPVTYNTYKHANRFECLLTDVD